LRHQEYFSPSPESQQPITNKFRETLTPPADAKPKVATPRAVAPRSNGDDGA
jgi:hypothetical protein